MRRAWPMAGWGISPSPAISFEVSTIMTRFLKSSAKHTGDFAQHGGLADAGTAQQQDALAGLDEVFDDLDRAEDSPADAAGQADDLALAVADGGDAVQGALDAGAVVVAEAADARGDVVDVGLAHLFVVEDDFLARETGLGRASQVEDYLQQLAQIFGCRSGWRMCGREDVKQGIQVIGNYLLQRCTTVVSTETL